MQNILHKTYWILIVFLTVGYIALSGCAAGKNAAGPNQNINTKTISKDNTKKPTLEILISTPDQYIGKSVEVSGVVYNIVTYRKSITVGISNEKIAEFLECEFLNATPPPAGLKKEQRIIVIGRVDVIKDVPYLRDCRVKQFLTNANGE